MKPRPFGLTDIMMLVVAAALGLWVNRTDWQGFEAFGYGDSYDKIQRMLTLVTPHLAATTMILAAIRMWRPRLPLRRLLRSPGAVACMVASAAVVVIGCWVASATAAGRGIEFSQHAEFVPNNGGHGRGGGFSNLLTGGLFIIYGDEVGFAVAGAWLSLLLSGRWRPERTWIDRLGRTMGWAWLSLAVVLWARSFLL